MTIKLGNGKEGQLDIHDEERSGDDRAMTDGLAERVNVKICANRRFIAKWCIKFLTYHDR